MKMIFIGMLLCMKLQCQTSSGSLAELREEAENLSATDPVPDEQRLLELAHCVARPLDINTVTVEILESLFGLPTSMARNLDWYRKKLGPLTDLMELQAVPGWDINQIRVLIPYFKVGSKQETGSGFQRIIRSGNHQFSVRLGMGFRANERGWFTGASPDEQSEQALKTAMRYRYLAPDVFSGGWMLARDAGEPWWHRGKHPGVDFMSFHLAFLNSRRWVRAVYLGDFRVSLGQGLTHWQSGFQGGQTLVLRNFRLSDPVRPHTGNDEVFFHRGFAVVTRLKSWQWFGFAGYTLQDATLAGSMAGTGDQVIRTIRTSGLHRTPGEIAGRNAAGQFSMGLASQWKRRTHEISVHMIRHQFSHPLERGPEPYRVFDMMGRSWLNASAGVKVWIRNLMFFGELAIDQRLSFALTGGSILSLGNRVDFSMGYRNLSPDYRAYQAGLASETGATANERAYSFALLWRLHTTVTAEWAMDHAVQPWLTNSLYGPGSVNQYRWILRWKPDKQTESVWAGHFLRRETQVRAPANPAYQIGTERRLRMRYQLSRKSGRQLQINIRTDFCRYSPDQGTALLGFAHSMEVKRIWSAWHLNISGRFTIFQTDHYDAAIYGLERDLPPTYLRTVLYGRGYRCLFLVDGKLFQSLRLSLRYAWMTQEGTNGERKQARDVSAQVQWNW